MIAAGIALFYLFAFGVLALVTRHTLRQNIRDAELAYAQSEADIRRLAYTPPMPERLPDTLEDDPAPPELTADALEEVRQMIEPILDRISQDSPDPATAHRRVRSLTDRLRAAVQSEMSSL